MPIRVREGNTWKLIANNSDVPSNVVGSYVHYGPTETTKRYYNTIYTNNTNRLIHVSATIGLEKDDLQLSGSTAKQLVSGSYTLAFITPSSTSSLLSNPLDSNGNAKSGVTEVANIRDNGTQNTEYLFLNPQFFVPINFSYIIKMYKSSDADWKDHTLNGSPLNVIQTFAWSEYEFALQ